MQLYDIVFFSFFPSSTLYNTMYSVFYSLVDHKRNSFAYTSPGSSGGWVLNLTACLSTSGEKWRSWVFHEGCSYASDTTIQ